MKRRPRGALTADIVCLLLAAGGAWVYTGAYGLQVLLRGLGLHEPPPAMAGSGPFLSAVSSAPLAATRSPTFEFPNEESPESRADLTRF